MWARSTHGSGYEIQIVDAKLERTQERDLERRDHRFIFAGRRRECRDPPEPGRQAPASRLLARH